MESTHSLCETKYSWIRNFSWLAFFCLLLGSCASAPTRQTTQAERQETFSEELYDSNGFIRPPNDTSKYRHLYFDNGLEVLLVSSEYPRAAVSLDLHAGSADNPEKFPGLAHFLEHMLFLGTQKYPMPDEYQKFIKINGGSYNATTGLDHTNYFFSINGDKLNQAMERLAQFFIAPLFTRKYIDKELKIIEEEYTRSKNSDGRGLYFVGNKLYNQQHPATRFASGNTESLLANGREALYAALFEFYQQYYKPDNMKLVVLGNQSLDQLEHMSRHTFGQIAATDPALLPKRPPLYSREKLPQLLQAKSKSERYDLSYSFPIPYQGKNYFNKSAGYISHLLGHEADGSLLAWLRKQNWATGLSAGLSGIGDDSALSIHIRLTKTGNNHIETIHKALFSYIDIINNQLLQENWRYSELQQLGKTSFTWLEDRDPLNEVRSLSRFMHYVPAKKIFAARYLYSGLNKAEVKKITSSLTPKNVAIKHVSPKLQADNIEPYYGIAYKLTSLADSFADTKNFLQEHKGQLYLPQPNKYIPAQLATNKVETQSLKQHKNTRLNAWLYQDASFANPRASIFMSLSGKEIVEDPKSRLLLGIYVNAVNQQLAQEFYNASLADYSFSLYPHSRGITLKVNGYDARISTLFEDILKRVISWKLTPKQFHLYREKMAMDIANEKLDSPVSRLYNRLVAVRLEHQWQHQERSHAVSRLGYKDWLKLVDTLSTLPSERTLLVHGEITNDFFDKLVNNIAGYFEAPNIDVQPPGIFEINGPELVKEPVQDNQTTKALAVVYGNLEKNHHNQVLMSMTARFLDGRFFHFMRTENTLGYQAGVNTYNLIDNPGLIMLVESRTAEPTTIAELYYQFFDLMQNQLPTAEEFIQLKEAYIQQLMNPPLKLENETNRIWYELFRRNYHFNNKEKLIAAAQAISIKELHGAITNILAHNQQQNRIWVYSGSELKLP